MNCIECIHYHHEPPQCRRFPPNNNIGGPRLFPSVDPEQDWCGEFESMREVVFEEEKSEPLPDTGWWKPPVFLVGGVAVGVCLGKLITWAVTYATS